MATPHFAEPYNRYHALGLLLALLIPTLPATLTWLLIFTR